MCDRKPHTRTAAPNPDAGGEGLTSGAGRESQVDPTGDLVNPKVECDTHNVQHLAVPVLFSTLRQNGFSDTQMTINAYCMMHAR